MLDASDARRDQVLAQASRREGIPYRLDPPPDGVNNLDCSLFVLVTFQNAGAPFPAGVRTAEQIRQRCEPIDWDAVKPGDLLFFEHTYEPNEAPGPDGHVASHIGISLGAGTRRMWDCHESTSGSRPSGVGQTDISSAYWQDRIFDARRPRQLEAEPVPSQPVRYQVTDDGVRLRAQPGTSQPILIENLGDGTMLQATGDPAVDADGHRWLNVQTADGTVGWVASEYLRPAGADQLTNEPDHHFSFQELWPHIQAAAQEYGADARIIAGIMAQESSFVNWRVHRDGTGHGLFGLDDNGLLPDFEAWSGLQCGRGEFAISIPPALQIEFCARIIAAFTRQYGSAENAARVWHRGPGLWQDAQGEAYAGLVRRHIAELFG
jgi:hypothetical protein